MDRDPKINPALKAWIDDVLVPALVRQYLDERCAVGDNGEGQREIGVPYATYFTVGRVRSAEDRFPSPDPGTSDEEPVQ